MISEDAGLYDSRIIMHIDFDYFFAQCEELRNPELRNRPIVVCVFSGRTEDSGVVSTANYVARKYGVKSGIPIRVAKARLAEISDQVFLSLDSNYYAQISESAMDIIRTSADKFEHAGIDECYLDVSSRIQSFKMAKEAAQKIKTQLRQKINLSCSIGVAPNKILAKMASDMQKPDGLTVIEPEIATKLIAPMEVDTIPGIGTKTSQRLHELGVKTISDLAKFDLFSLTDEFGKNSATFMYNASRGINDEPVDGISDKQQIMRIITLKKNPSSSREMYEDLYELCQSILKKAVDQKLFFKNIGILLIFDNLDSIIRSKSLKVHSSNFELLYAVAKSILDDAMSGLGSTRIRRLGVRISEFNSGKGQNTMLDFMGVGG